MTHSSAQPELVYVCLTHVPLPLAFPDYVTPLYSGEAQGDGQLNLRDLAPQWVQHHPALGSIAGTFALKNLLLTRHPQAGRVGICHYRKFISPQRISGVRSPSYKVMDVVHADLLRGAAFGELMHPGSAEFLVSAPRVFTRLPWYRRGYLKEYARDHHVEDLLRFTAAAVEQGVLDSTDVLPFLNEDVLIPGGIELGVYPAAFWIEHIGQVETVARSCVERYPARREGYQARAWAFCAERLGSYMLLKHFRSLCATDFGTRHSEWLNRRRWTRRFAGQMNLITQHRDERGYVGGV